MENSIYVGLSRQQALQAQMDIVSNNIANMSTPGYKSQNMVFQEYLSKPNGYKKVQEPISMVLDYGQYQNTAAGTLHQTSNPLDVAIQGPGWFGVNTPSGVQYTRAGNFQMDATGQLVTTAGQTVAADGGGAIIIPSDAKDIRIGEDGTIATDKGVLGKLMLVEFANDQDLEAAGNGLYQTKAAATPSAASKIAQGFLENSNVSPVLEMTRMLDVLRAYQTTERMLQTEHDRERNMIQQLGNSRG